MADIIHVNSIALKSLKTEFDGEKSNFENSTYSKFKSSYFCSTSNPVISRMRSQLENIYGKLDSGYKNIDKWWSDYNISVEELENLLSKRSTAATKLDASVTSYVNGQLLGLEDNTNMLGLSLFSSTPDTGKSFNAVFSMSTDFSSLYQDYVEEEVVVEDKTWLEKKMSWVETEARALSANIEQVYKSTGATVVNAVTGLAEGVGEFGEAVCDTAITLNVAIATIPTAGYDLVKLGSNKVFGTEFESTTVKMWDATKSFVAKKHVDTFFSETVRGDNFFGNYLRESYFYEETRAISEGIGYMAGVIIVTAATGGIAGGALASSSAVVSATTSAAVAATAGFGKGAEKSWGDGASVTEGLTAGAFTAVKDGIQYAIGAKMAKAVMPFAGKVSSEALKKTLNGSFRVTVDSATGALEEAAVPFIDVFYKKGYYSVTGEFVEFTNQGFMERYNELFNDNGGWASIRNGAVMGAAMSGLMEVIPAGFKKLNKNSNVEPVVKKENVIEPDLIRLNPKSRVAFDGKYDVQELKLLTGDKEISLVNSGIILNETSALYKFDYKDWLGNKTSIFSDNNLTEMLKDVDEVTAKKIVEDFLSPKRVFTAENGYVGGLELADSNIKKFKFEGTDQFFKSSSQFKSYESGYRFDKTIGLDYKINEVGKYVKDGQNFNSYLIKTSDMPNGKIIHTSDDLFDFLGSMHSQNFRKHFETEFLQKNILENLSEITDLKFSLITGTPKIYYKRFEKVSESSVSDMISKLSKDKEINVKNVTADTIEYTDATKFNTTKIQLVRGVKKDGIIYYLYNFSSGFASNKKIFTDINLMEQFKKIEAGDTSTKKIIEDFLDADRLNAMTKASEIAYLGKIVTDGTDSFRIVSDIDIAKKISNTFVNMRDVTFDKTPGTGASYGVDQNIHNRVLETRGNSYFSEKGKQLNLKAINEYKMDDYDAIVTLKYMDSVGACSYADTANVIFASFADKPQKFKEVFGFDMFESVAGRTELNTSELLLDMYVFANSQENGGKIFKRTADGMLQIANEKGVDLNDVNFSAKDYFNAEDQAYMSYSNGIRSDLLNKYLKSKQNDIDFSTKQVFDNINGDTISKETFEGIIKNVERELLNGTQVSLIVTNKNNAIRFLTPDENVHVTTDIWSEGQTIFGQKTTAGHAIFVTGISENGFIVSSWGKKLILPFEDFLHGSSFGINLSKIINGGN